MNINEQMLEKIMERIDERLLASHQSKDSEVSGLHREILNKLDNLDKFVERASPVIKMAENLTGTAKIILTVCASIGILAGGIIGFKEIISNLIKTH